MSSPEPIVQRLVSMRKKELGGPTSVWFPKGMLKRFDEKRGLASRSVIVQRLVGLWLSGKISLKEKPKKQKRRKRRKA